MAASIEVSYFNSFWLKQVRDTNSDAVWPDGYPYQSAFPGSAVNGDNNWFIEESRIRGGYNNTQVDLGGKSIYS